MKRLVMLCGSALIAVGGAVFGFQKPVQARENRDGKTVLVSGIAGCDCTKTEPKECICIFGS